MTSFISFARAKLLEIRSDLDRATVYRMLNEGHNTLVCSTVYPDGRSVVGMSTLAIASANTHPIETKITQTVVC